MKRIILSICFFTIVFSSGMYYFYGDAKGVMQYWHKQSEQNRVAKAMKNIHSPQQVISKLKAHLKTDPKSAKGWFLLGSLYSDIKQYQKAQPAMLRAHTLKPKNLLYVASLVEVNYFKQHGKLTQNDRRKLKTVLKKQPKNVVALNLLAFDAYHRKAYKKAVMTWEKLLAIFPSRGQEHAMLLKMIAKAQKEEFHAG